MKKVQKSTKRRFITTIATVTAVVVGGISAIFGASNNSTSQTVTFEKSTEVFGNPLMGYTPSATYSSVADDVELLYVDITWRELEPSKGVYDWASIEAENKLNKWKSEGKHIVLRFVCDFPRSETHMDIPDWLYEEMNHAGDWYDISYGKGFSPDYTNEAFRTNHERAVRAIAEYFGNDGFVSYIELGVLGHWGEWHVNYGTGQIRKLPTADIRDEYVSVWKDAFPDTHIMMRRPFAIAAGNKFGLYNDMIGHPESTSRWLEWIQEGGRFDQTGEEWGLLPMPDFWKTAPSGGEFTSSISMSDMLETNLDRTLTMLRDSHTTFIGPHTASQSYSDAYNTILLNMGYRLRIKEARIEGNSDGVTISLKWTNDGVAPFYKNWPVYLYLEDTNGNELGKVKVDIDLRTVLPDTEVQSTTLTTAGCIASDSNISIGIVDPMTGQDAVRLAMNAPRNGKRTILFSTSGVIGNQDGNVNQWNGGGPNNTDNNAGGGSNTNHPIYPNDTDNNSSGGGGSGGGGSSSGSGGSGRSGGARYTTRAVNAAPIAPQDTYLGAYWSHIEGNWYLIKSDGNPATGWALKNGKWYYLGNTDGAMSTGWILDGEWYYLRADGDMLVGWLEQDGKWYYLRSNGAMATGWHYINENWYCFKEDGEMLADTITPDNYRVDASGAWVA